jgi:hypothetical protein
MAVGGDGEEKAWYVVQWFVKCSNKLYKCAINPTINPKPVYKSRSPQKYVTVY